MITPLRDLQVATKLENKTALVEMARVYSPGVYTLIMMSSPILLPATWDASLQVVTIGLAILHISTEYTIYKQSFCAKLILFIAWPLDARNAS